MLKPSALDTLVAGIGFVPLAIGQCLSIGGPPRSVSIYRGGIDDKVVASGSPEFLERILAGHAGAEPSIMGSPETAATVTGMPPTTVCAMGGWPLIAPGGLARLQILRSTSPPT